MVKKFGPSKGFAFVSRTTCASTKGSPSEASVYEAHESFQCVHTHSSESRHAGKM